MEIKELRIGNLLDRNGIMEVLEIGANNKLIIYDHYNKERLPYGLDVASFKGIELTPEWLERAKFQLVDETMASGVEGIKGPYYAKDALLLWSNGSEPKSAYLVFYADGFFGKYKAVQGRWIHTVHDLQNTYHAWKGEELAIDKTSLKN